MGFNSAFKELNYVDWLFRVLLNDGKLEVKFVSYGILFTIQQELIHFVEQTHQKKKKFWNIVGYCQRDKGTVTCG